MKKTELIPCCYHPTMPILVDDDRNFQAIIVTALKNQYHCRTYTHASEALVFLNEDYQTNLLADRCLTSLENEPSEHRWIDMDISVIHEQVYNPRRFKTIAVFIIDYHMPDMNGLVFCEQLDASFKKILLTGVADEKIAIQAFNQGLIDHYIRKDDPLLVQKLRESIKQLEQAYFVNLSETVTRNMAVNSNIWGKSYFNDPGFSAIFYPFYEKQKAVEYYLMSFMGNFLFLDAQGNPSELAIVSEENMKSLVECIELDDMPVPPEILSALQKREKLFASYDEIGKKPPSEWLPYLHAAQKIESHGENYYYSYIEKPDTTNLDREKILPYHAYLERFMENPNLL